MIGLDDLIDVVATSKREVERLPHAVGAFAQADWWLREGVDPDALWKVASDVSEEAAALTDDEARTRIAAFLVGFDLGWIAQRDLVTTHVREAA